MHAFRLRALAISAMAAALGFASPALAASTPAYQTLVPTPIRDAGTRPGVWLGVATFSFQTGTTSIFLHEDCPATNPVVINGAFALNSIGQTSDVSLGYNGPRLDESPPSFHEWGWHFYWPAGSPAGTTAQFSLFCGK